MEDKRNYKTKEKDVRKMITFSKEIIKENLKDKKDGEC